MLVNGKKNLNGHSSNQRHQLPIICSRDVDGQRVAVGSSGRIQEFVVNYPASLGKRLHLLGRSIHGYLWTGAQVGVTDEMELR